MNKKKKMNSNNKEEEEMENEFKTQHSLRKEGEHKH